MLVSYVLALHLPLPLICDTGTMSPVEHGEIFCVDSGAEMDLDIVSLKQPSHLDALVSSVPS
jgi:CTP synthase (UTP-ammonia lyase)